MSEFHRIWIDQCAVAEGIRERFGVNDALRYLVGEKLLLFMEVSHERPEFAAELPQFVNRIRDLFETHEIVSFFAALEAGQTPDPAKLLNGGDSEGTEIDEDAIVRAAEKILLVENARRLLVPDAVD
jgi:hypothetical protein